MSDLIDRQAAIDALISFFGLSIEEEYGSAIQEVLNGLPSAQSERKWIPVAEGLPGYGEKVLCCVDGRIYIDERNLRGWRYRVTEYDAWMPLPKPWKGECDAEVR